MEHRIHYRDIKNDKSSKNKDPPVVHRLGKDPLTRLHMKQYLKEKVGLRPVEYGIYVEAEVGKLKSIKLVL